MATYDPLAVETMCVALDEAWQKVPPEERTEQLHKKMAAALLHSASAGIRDPKYLSDVALKNAPASRNRRKSDKGR